MDRAPEYASSLKLDDPLDGVELIRTVEQAYGVRFGNETAWRTVGDMEAALLERFPTRERPGSCPTSMAFYRLRRAVSQALALDQRLTPRTPLRMLGRGSPKRHYSELRRRMELRLPNPSQSALGATGALLAIGGVPAIFAAMAFHAWWLLALLPAGVILVKLDPGRFGRTTLGDLARNVAALNYGALADEGADRRPHMVWRMLQQAVSSIADIEPERVSRDTAFN